MSYAAIALLCSGTGADMPSHIFTRLGIGKGVNRDESSVRRVRPGQL